MHSATTRPSTSPNGPFRWVLMLPRRTLLFLIQVYQYSVGLLLPPACRFQPTCSRYAAEAIQRHGAGRGSWLTLRRLARCQPWGGSGYDPVPS